MVFKNQGINEIEVEGCIVSSTVNDLFEGYGDIFDSIGKIKRQLYYKENGKRFCMMSGWPFARKRTRFWRNS